MTKKDYIAIAQVIKEADQHCTPSSDVYIFKLHLIDNLCTIFKKDNSAFNIDMFKLACTQGDK